MLTVFYIVVLFFLFAISDCQEWTEAEKEEFKNKPWDNANNEPQYYTYSKNCPHFNCPDGFSCARLGNGQQLFDYPKACIRNEKICDRNEVCHYT